MRYSIEHAPRNGTAIILEDDASGTYDVARWSIDAGKWIGENGEPTKITPTHWYPIPRDQYLTREDGGAGIQLRSGRGRRLAAIAVTLLAAASVATYFFRAEIAAHVTRYAGQESRFGVDEIGRYAIGLFANQSSRKITVVAEGPIYAGPAATPADAPQVPQIATAPVAETPPPSKEGSAEGPAQEPAESGLAIVEPEGKLEAEVANSARSLEEEREKAAGLALETVTERKELAAITEQHRQALEAERARTTALARELANAQRENEKQAALLKAGTEAAQHKQAEAATSARSLEEARGKADALAAEAADARKELAASREQHRQALEEERARGVALARELAAAQQENDKGMALLKASGEEAGQRQQAEAAQSARSLEEARKKADALELEAAAARQELAASTEQHRQAVDEERGRHAAIWSELATAQREIEQQAAQLRQAGKEAEQFKKVAEGATAELRQYQQRDRDRTEAMARDGETSPRTTTGARARPGPPTVNPASRAAQATEVAAVAQPAAPEAQGSPEAARLIARATALLGQGDVGAARIVLERASEAGSAKASFMLAETYDPAVLTAWGTYGTRGEVAKAREFYAKAQAGGIQEARSRLNALPQ